MNFEEVIRVRHATRNFSSKKVERELIDQILEAGRLAPTAKNLQAFYIYVIESPEGIEKIDRATPCRYGAPVVFLICGNRDVAFVKNGKAMYEMDAVIVGTHMMLEATNVGVQNIWIEYFDEEILRKEFSIPDHLIPVSLLPIGYEKDDCPINPNHSIRKDLKDLVEYQ